MPDKAFTGSVGWECGELGGFKKVENAAQHGILRGIIGRERWEHHRVVRKGMIMGEEQDIFEPLICFISILFIFFYFFFSRLTPRKRIGSLVTSGWNVNKFEVK